MRADRANELASIERALMIGLEAASSETRPVWLVALNATLPDPFRAAVMSTEAALRAFGRGPNSRRDAVVETVRRRVLARTEESALLGPVARLQRKPVMTQLDAIQADTTTVDVDLTVKPVPRLT